MLVVIVASLLAFTLAPQYATAATSSLGCLDPKYDTGICEGLAAKLQACHDRKCLCRQEIFSDLIL
jgi:hypothetical protein